MHILHYNADTDTEPQGGSSSTHKSDSADVLQRFSGDAVRMANKISELEGDNYRYREQLRDIKAKVPPADAVILSKDEAALWEKLKPHADVDITALQQQYQDAQQRLTQLERQQAISQAAQLAGYNAAVLGKLPDLPAVVVKDVTADGKTQQQPFVALDGKEEPLSSYIEQHYSEFLPALKPQTEHGSPGGTPYPRQADNGQGAQKLNAGQQHIRRTKFSIPSTGAK